MSDIYVAHQIPLQDQVDQNTTDIGNSADSALSNLTSPTAVNQDLLPASNKNLGSAIATWSSLFIENIKLKGSTSGYVNLIAPATVTDYSITFPGAVGTAGQFLQTDASGVTSWTTVVSAQTLNEAYQEGNVIPTSSADGDVLISGTEKLEISANGGLVVSGGLTQTISAPGASGPAATDQSMTTLQALTNTSDWAGQSFTVNTTGALSEVRIRNHTDIVNITSGTMQVDVYLADGSDKPTGPIIESSTLVPAGSLLVDQFQPYVFSGSNILTTGVKYSLVVNEVNAVGGGVRFLISSSSLLANGNRLISTDNGSTWNANFSSDLAFEVDLVPVGAGPNIRMNAFTSGYVDLLASETTTSYALKLPPAVGSAGDILTDAAGDGVLSWVTPPSSDLVDDTTPQLGGDLDVNGKDITSSAAVEIVSLNGELKSSSSTTNSTSKVNALSVGHYLNAEESFSGINLTATAGGNLVNIGGGNGFGDYNSATAISFYTSTNTTTISGTKRMGINSGGKISFLDGTQGTPGNVWTEGASAGEGSWATPPAAGANATLSNLTSPTNINQHLIPGTNKHLGSLADPWSTTYSTAIQIGTSGGVGKLNIHNAKTSPTAATGPAMYGAAAENVLIYTPQTQGTGSIHIETGGSAFSAGALAGDINIQTGNLTGGSPTAPGGAINIETGTTSGTGDGGSVNIQTGIITGTGNRGTINFIDGSEVSAGAGAVWTQAAADGVGGWAAAAGGGANLTLSNLGTTNINDHLIPANSFKTLGTGAKAWILNSGNINVIDTGTEQSVATISESSNIVNFVTSKNGYGLNLSTFDSFGSNPGDITLSSGANNDPGSALDGSDISLTGGQIGGSGKSGDVILESGASTGAGTRGNIQLKDGSEVSAGAGAVWTQAAADGIGGWAAAAGSGATTELDNLGTTAINADLLPDGITRDLGNATDFWANVNARELDLFNVSANPIFKVSDYLGFGIGIGIQALKENNNIYMNTAASTSASDSGDIIIETGDGTGTNTSSGDIILETGAKSGTGARGSVTFKDGTDGTPGNVWTEGAVAGEGSWVAPVSPLRTVTSYSSAQTLVVGTDDVVTVTGTTTVTLPPVQPSNVGVQFDIKNMDASLTTTVKGNAAELIDAANTQVLTTQYQSITVVCTITGWVII